jgi:hypothetical protein
MIGTRITAETNRPVVPESKVRWLGNVAGFDYAEHAGHEYAVDPHATPDIGAYSKQPGEILIGKQVTEYIDGSRFEHNNHHRALPVGVGTYAALAAREAERKAKREAKPKPRPLDALGTHALLTRRADSIVPVADPSRTDRLLDAALSYAPDEAPADLFVSLRSKAPSAIHLPGRELRQGVAAILDVLQAKGVTLALTDAGTMFATGTRITNEVRSLIERASPLLHAYLRGQPLRCEMKHPDNQAPEAVSLLVGGAAACAQHLAGEIEP